MNQSSRTQRRQARKRRLGHNMIVFAVSLLLLIAVFRGVFVLYYHEFFTSARREFRIPGLSEDFVPQGMAPCGEGKFFLSGYLAQSGYARIYFVDARGISRMLRVTQEDGVTLVSHAGGIACAGDFTYLVGSGTCYVFDTAALLDPSASTAVITHEFLTGNRASFCDVQGGSLLVGEYAYGTKFQTAASHHIRTPAGDRNTALVLAFQLDGDEKWGVREIPSVAYSIPERIQGMCYADDGRMVLSASSAFGASQLYLYDCGAAVSRVHGLRWESGNLIPLYYLDSSCCADILPLPPYAEETAFADGQLYLLFESASSRFQFGRLVGGDYVYRMELPEWGADEGSD